MTDKKVLYGTVVWFGAGGYGFLKPEDESVNGGADCFVHYSQIVDNSGKFKKLVAGERVTFTIGANKNGPQAENVTVVRDEEE